MQKRDHFLVELEEKIRKNAPRKDKLFVLSRLLEVWGVVRFARKQDGFKVFAVDGEWIRNNISVIFGAGGHGYVHEFIPLDEIWVSTRHFEGCGCDI